MKIPFPRFTSGKFAAVPLAALAMLSAAGCDRPEPAQEIVPTSKEPAAPSSPEPAGTAAEPAAEAGPKPASTPPAPGDSASKAPEDVLTVSAAPTGAAAKSPEADGPITEVVQAQAPPAPAQTPAAPSPPSAPSTQADKGKLTERREQQVSFVWFSGEPGTDSATGGASPMTVRVEPNAGGNPAVGVMEEYSGGTGQQWRAAAWLAAFNASNTLGRSITEAEYTVKVGGHVDGPSAGMLTTATMMALLNGDTVRTDTTMTGTINPDGTAGPVGGIPQKLKGAKAKGLTRFGFPIGGRSAQDLRTGELVDLIDLGKREGVEVREIRDVWDAYEFVTGKSLARPQPIQESEMELSADQSRQIEAKLLGWQATVEGELPKVRRRYEQIKETLGQLENGAQIDAPLVNLWNMADTAISEAENFRQSGYLTAAYQRYMQAAYNLKTLSLQLELLPPFLAADLPEILTHIEGVQSVRNRVESLALDMQVSSRHRTVGGLINAVSGMATYAQGLGIVRLGDAMMEQANEVLASIDRGEAKLEDPEVRAKLGPLLEGPILYYAMADILVVAAREAISFSAEEGDQAGDLAAARGLAKGYATASGACLAYLDALVTQRIADEQGLSSAQAQAVLNSWEFEMPIIRMTTQLAEGAPAIFKEDPSITVLGQLAFGAYTYLASASLVNKHYSLGASLDQNGMLVLSNRRALGYQLDSAKRRALEAAGQCKERLGFVPFASVQEFQTANAFRDGNDFDKLNALRSYWTSTFWSQLALTAASQKP